MQIQNDLFKINFFGYYYEKTMHLEATITASFSTLAPD